MLGDLCWFGVVGLAYMRNQDTTTTRTIDWTRNNDPVVEPFHVPRWLENSTARYIRPIMGEYSLWMRVHDEHTINDDEPCAITTTQQPPHPHTSFV
jgi:hypothetical protein